MQIQYFGHSYFKITTKENGVETHLVIDPFDKANGLKPVKNQADILLISANEPDYNNLESTKENGSNKQFVINGPGEYEINSVFVQGIESGDNSDNTIYYINSESITITHLGKFAQKSLNDSQLETIEGTDIVMIPVGGGSLIDTKTATKIISQLEPRIIIPMYYALPGLKDKIDPLDKFVKEIGLKAEEMDKLKISPKDLPQEETKLVVLKV